MAYFLVENFRSGLDVRKSILTAPAGTLTRLVNAAITPGGEIAKRKAFVKVATLTNTFGLASLGNKLVAFTRDADATSPALPIGDVTLQYQRLPNSSTSTVMTDFEEFDGKLYVVLSDPSAGTEKARNPHYYDRVETEGSGKGFYVRSYKSKMYCLGDKYLRFSAIENPSLWEPATDPNDTTRTGAGFINISLQEGDSGKAMGLEIYYDKLAVMSEWTTQMWSVASDPKQNVLGQILQATGTKAPWSVKQYGSGDVLFLASSGIRSLKARDISNSAAVSDIGSPIDDYVRALPTKYGSPTFLSGGKAILEPVVGRFWLAFPREIMVLSYFPGPNVTAWSVYTTPFNVEHIVTAGERVFLRSGDDLYLYGGFSGEEYDDCEVEVRLPFLDGSKPGHMKMFQAIDATVTGTWEARIAYNYDLPDAEEVVGTLSSPTWNKGRYELNGYASHMSLRFYSQGAGAATISNVAIHYNMATDAD